MSEHGMTVSASLALVSPPSSPLHSDPTPPMHHPHTDDDIMPSILTAAAEVAALAGWSPPTSTAPQPTAFQVESTPPSSLQVESGPPSSLQVERTAAVVRSHSSREVEVHRAKQLKSTSSVRVMPVAVQVDDSAAAQVGVLELQLRAARSANERLQRLNEKLELQLKRALHVLRLEVGSDVDLNSSSVEEGWRGRAQAIVLFKSRVAELELQLAAFKSSAGTTSTAAEGPSDAELGLGLESAAAPAATSTPAAVSSAAVSRSTSTLNALATRNRRALDEAHASVAQLSGEVDALRSKCSGYRARVAVLEGDVKGLKSAMAVLIAKGETDDALIAALKSELTLTRQRLLNARAASAASTPDRSAPLPLRPVSTASSAPTGTVPYVHAPLRSGSSDGSAVARAGAAIVHAATS